jgi:hypothetical protein
MTTVGTVPHVLTQLAKVTKATDAVVAAATETALATTAPSQTVPQAGKR